MKEYDDKTLKLVQACELMILDDFLAICEKEHLTYFGLAGTALGAVRHGGFIPWDDDIDVGLPREDMAKLIEVVKRDYSDKYTILNADEDIAFPLPTVHMKLKDTVFCEESLANVPVDFGIFLDLYSFDPVADDERAYKKQAWDAWLWSHIRLLLSIPSPVLPFVGLKKRLALWVCRIASTVFHLVGITSQKAFEREEAARSRYVGQSTKRIAYLCDTDRFSQTLAWDELMPFYVMEFEGRKLNFPAQWKQHLTDMYGDYMQLPPVERRKNHFPARLDFGPYLDLLQD